MLNPPWTFRPVRYGHGLVYLKGIINHLRLVGYDYAISIEHEDALMSQNEGLSKAVATLKEAIMTETPSEMWWV